MPEAQNLPAVLSVLDLLTEDELHQLNEIIVARLRLMQQIRSHGQMMNFHLGQRVHFTSSTGELIRGFIKSHNRKSVTIITDTGIPWRVAPGFLQPD